MVVWLASYPKSGNTFLRLLLLEYFFGEDKNKYNYTKEFSKDFLDYKENNSLEKEILQWKQIFEDDFFKKKLVFLKSHAFYGKVDNIETFPNNIEHCIIYVWRDPKEVCLSLKDYFKMNINQSFEFIKKKDATIKNGNKYSKGYIPLGDWLFHYNSFYSAKKNILLVKYEELLNNTFEEMQKILFFLKNFINFKQDDILLKSCVNKFDLKNFNQDIELHKEIIEKFNLSDKNFFNYKKIRQENLQDSEKIVLSKIEDLYSNFYK